MFAKYSEDTKLFQQVHNGYINERSIAFEMAHCLFEDREKNIWVATDNNGLYRFNPATEFFKNIKHIDRLNGLPGKGGVMSFLPTRRGTILVGTWGDGLYEYDSNFNAIPIGIKGLGKVNPFAWSMIASADSNSIWIASQPGIYKIDQALHAFTYYNPAILKKGTIRQIAEDKQGNLWVGMAHSGVFKWTAASVTKIFEDGLAPFTAIPPVQINKITVDTKGLVWVGTPENGVYVIDPVADKIAFRFGEDADAEKKLPERGVSSILEYSDSIIIISTATRIFCYNRSSNQSYVIGAKGMISGFITALEKDRAGYVWLTSTNGLYRINVHKKIFVKFSRDEGIDNEHFVQSASATLPDGRIAFGTTNDIVLLDPGKIKIVSPKPVIQVTDCKIMGQSISLDSLAQQKQLTLGYEDNSLSIQFSPLVYNSPWHIKYKLDGLDTYWKTADKNNEATYNYLPSGTYTFLLKAIDEEGRETAEVQRLHITVRPPFWKTWWFYSLLVLAVGCILFWLDRERMNRKKSIQSMRTDIADNLYQDVQTALGNINILSEIATIKADKDVEKSKDYIRQINNKSQQMLVAMDDMLWGMHPENDSMQKTLERIKEHIDSLQHQHNIKIDLMADEKVAALKLNMKLRQHVFLMLKNGITNIIKTGAASYHIQIALEDAQLIYTLAFDNAGADMQQLNNLLQRQELEKKLQQVNGKLSIQQQKTITSIRLAIPL